MKMLIATHSYLLEANLSLDDEGSPSGGASSVAGTGHFYGLALTPQGVIAARRRNRQDASLQLLNVTTGEELEYETPMSDVHQMCYGNGGLYIANTKYNSVVYKNLTTGREDTFTIGPEARDINHLNSVYVRGSEVWVLAHNLYNTISKLYRLRHSEDAGFDYSFHGEHLYRLYHKGAHNLLFDQGNLFYNASDQSRLACVNALSGELKFTTPLGPELPHTKGLAATDDWIFVGSSAECNVVERYECPAVLSIIDRREGKYPKIGEIALKAAGQEVGNVNEIRVLSEQDYGHTARRSGPKEPAP